MEMKRQKESSAPYKKQECSAITKGMFSPDSNMIETFSKLQQSQISKPLAEIKIF